MARRSDINWQAVELDFRVGELSVRQIARKHQISDSNLRVRAKREHWSRDDGEQSRRAAREALAAATSQRACEIGAEIGAQQARIYMEAMEGTALTAVEVTQEHQRVARRGMAVALRVLNELELACNCSAVTEEEIRRCKEDDPSRAALIERQLGLKARIDGLEKWASSFARLAAAEREAHDIGAADKPNAIDELLLRLGAERNGVRTSKTVSGE